MKILQQKWSQDKGWSEDTSSLDKKNIQLVFAFGDRFILSDPKRFEELKDAFPHAHIILASTAGNIKGTNLDDASIVVTAIFFEKPLELQVHRISLSEAGNSSLAGEKLGKKLPKNGLKHVFLFADGHLVNGSDLIKGLSGTLPKSVSITGGLAGDGTRFEKTVVGANAPPQEGEIVIVGFYSSHLKFGCGSVGGWDPFGIERKITRSSSNILYELDNKSALDLYKKYLGEQARELPSSAMLFPLAIRPDRQSRALVRTILSIDEKNQGMVFAGNMPEGWYAQLMKANFDRLVDGAFRAALYSLEMVDRETPDLAILISCVGRRIVLGPRAEEEIEIVKDLIGNETTIAGFYSYGEIAPTAPLANCKLHNQTMTITTIVEK